MMTQSVRTRTEGLFDNSAVSGSPKGRNTGSSFEQIIGKSDGGNLTDTMVQSRSRIKQTRDLEVKKNQKSEGEQPAKPDRISDSDAARKAGQSTRTEQPAAVREPAKAEQPDINSEEKPDRDSEAMAQIAGILQAVTDAVKKVLNLSEEELNQLLAEQGLTREDLLSGQNLQQLILAGSGQTSIMAALTDETLAQQMNELLGTLEDIKADAGLELTQQQLEDLLKSMKSPGDAVTDPSIPIKGSAEGDAEAAAVNDMHGQNIPAAQVGTGKTEAGNLEENQTAGFQGANPEEKSANVSEASLTDAQEESGKREQQDTKASEQFETFLNNLTSHTATVTQTEAGGDVARITELRDIVNQIIERIKVSVKPDQASMELQLNPEHLGRVNLTVESKSGVLTAHFVVQNEISKEAIESQLHVLRDNLNQQGIKVEAIEVTVAANSFEQYGQGQTDQGQEAEKNSSRTKITLQDAMNMTEENGASTEAENSIMDDYKGSRIDYTA